MKTKKVVRVYEHGSAYWVGDGFPVRNMIPTSGLSADIDPFLMLDYAGPQKFAPTSKRRGVGEHPHRGFETVTISYQGSVEHRDSAGNCGRIDPGDVQWMTAGSGVVHEELHALEFGQSGGIFELIQLWINLPKKNKMATPRYQTLLNVDIPKVDLGGSSFARVISGELHGVKGIADTFTEINLFDVVLRPGEVALKVPSNFNTALFLLDGSIRLGDTQIKGNSKILLLDSEGDTISIVADTESKLLILNAKPLNEPVANMGPFVMNTREEIDQAFSDYREGRMGHLPAR